MKNKGLIIFAGIALVGLLGLMSFYGFINSTRNEGIALEQQLSKEYSDNQNYLSAYISTIYEQAGIADKKTAKLDSILTNAIQGRYGEDGFKANGQMFSAIAESYPDLTQNLNIYDKIADQIAGGREQFRNRQTKLLDQIRVYETWLQQGVIRHIVIESVLGFPSNKLEARIGGKVVARGADALEQFNQLVLTGSTTEAFTTGKMEPLNFK